MQLQLDIGFDQLVQLVKKMPYKQWAELKQEVEKKQIVDNSINELETFLLKAPTFSEKQFSEIINARKEINQWRTKQS